MENEIFILFEMYYLFVGSKRRIGQIIFRSSSLFHPSFSSSSIQVQQKPLCVRTVNQSACLLRRALGKQTYRKKLKRIVNQVTLSKNHVEKVDIFAKE